MSMTPPKPTRARRRYRCHACGDEIEPGDLYRRRTITRAVGRAPSVELRDGYPTVVENCFRVQARVCQRCS